MLLKFMVVKIRYREKKSFSGTPSILCSNHRILTGDIEALWALRSSKASLQQPPSCFPIAGNTLYLKVALEDPYVVPHKVLHEVPLI